MVSANVECIPAFRFELSNTVCSKTDKNSLDIQRVVSLVRTGTETVSSRASGARLKAFVAVEVKTTTRPGCLRSTPLI